MSIRLSDTVWGYSKARGSTFTVGLGIADYADDEGYAWPSIERLATKCRVSKRTVNTAVKELVRLGEIEIVERGGYRYGKPRANTYRIILKPNPQDSHLGKSPKAQDSQVGKTPNTQPSTPEHADDGTPNMQSGATEVPWIAPQPSIEPSEEPSTEPPGEKSEGDLFEEWNRHYCEWTGREPERNTDKSRRLFDARRKEGHPLEELKAATRAACADEWHRNNGMNVPLEILSANRIERLIWLDQKFQEERRYTVPSPAESDANAEVVF